MEKSFMQFQDMREAYERNNRSNGMKALRCFPRCRETGHVRSGFCGTSLKCALEVQIDDQSPRCQLDDSFWRGVTYIAEMRELHIPGLSSVRFVSRQEIDTQLRSRPEKFKSLIEGKPTNIKSIKNMENNVITKIISIEFNSQCQAWHYGWQSHKYKKDTKHCVDVLVLIENGNDGYFVAASFVSPEFEIVSTKTVQKKSGVTDEGITKEDSTRKNTIEETQPMEKAVQSSNIIQIKEEKDLKEESTENDTALEQEEIEEGEDPSLTEILASMKQSDIVEL